MALNILLVYPYYPYSSVTTFEEPLGLLYLAQVLQAAGHQVDVVDLTFQKEVTFLRDKARWAEVVGLSAPTPLFATAAKILAYVKEINPGLKTIIGGPHATAFPTDALQAGFDVAVIGEGEATVVDLMAAWEEGRPLDVVAGIAFPKAEGIHQTNLRPFIADLDTIPFPARHYIDYSRYRRIGLIVMRGCPYRCLYCKPIEEKLFGKKLRKRSLQNVVEEIATIISRYGNRQISFKDDTLTVNNTAWFVGLNNLLAARQIRLSWQCSSRVDTVDREKLLAMKAAGCRQIFFGIESGSQRILDYYRKDITVDKIITTFDLCREVGIRACASVMLGAPIETRDDLEKTYRLIKRIKPFNWHLHITTPICGTYLYDQVLAEGRISPELNYQACEPTGNLYRLHLPMDLDHLSGDDIAEYRDRINRGMKYRLLIACLVDREFWRELFTSRGLRTIVFNFLRRHFAFKKHSAPM